MFGIWTDIQALLIQFGRKQSYRVYTHNPSFEKILDWKPHPYLDNVEYSWVYVRLDSCPHTYARLRRKQEPQPKPMPVFDWLRDYGPHWEPQSTAFWLEPDTADQFAGWLAKYRPGVPGLFDAGNGVTVNIRMRDPFRDTCQRQIAYNVAGSLIAQQQMRSSHLVGIAHHNSYLNGLKGR